MNIDEIKEKISNAIKFTTNAKGYTLVNRGWGSLNNKCAYPLTCLVLSEYDEKNITQFGKEIYGPDISKKAQEILQVSGDWIHSFFRAFDGSFNYTQNVEAAQLGKKLAVELHPKRMKEIVK